MVGKWHLCPTDEMNLAAPRRNWPTGRGFERWYGFLGAETNQWYPDLVYDNHLADQPKTPEEGYHLTEDLADRAITWVRTQKSLMPDKPFFVYFAPGATHAPHHVPRSGPTSTRVSSRTDGMCFASARSPGSRSSASSQRMPSSHRATRRSLPGTTCRKS